MRVVTNFRIKANEISKYGKLLGRKYLGRAMGAALEEVGLTSASDFFDPNTGNEDQWGKPPKDDILTSRSGRLISSVLSSKNFNASEIPQSVRQLMSQRSTSASDSKGKNEGIRKVTISSTTIQGIIGSKTPYAYIHEKGGVIHGKPTMTFVGLNGSLIKASSVTIPARPYLEPAVRKAFPRVKKIMEEMVEATFKSARI